MQEIQPVFAIGQVFDQSAREVDLVGDVESAREREIATDEQPAVRAFAKIGSVPVLPLVASAQKGMWPDST